MSIFTDTDLEESKLSTNHFVNKNQFGNLIVLTTKCMHISIGPHYKQFILGFSMLLAYQFGLMWAMLFHVNNIILIKISAILSILTPIFYLLTALRNPGIYYHKQCLQPKIKYCNKCQHFTSSKIIHCNFCNICIEGYDHHCRWISKCIGKNNVYSFYAFIGMLSVLNFFLYYAIYSIFWSNNHNQQNKTD